MPAVRALPGRRVVARPIRKGKLGKPNEVGYVTQLTEVTENTRRARVS